MAGTTKLMTAGGGGVSLTPASSIASDVTVQIPASNGTVITTASSGKVIPTAALPAGTVLQVVQGTKTSGSTTTSTSFVTTGLTASITPTASTSKIYATFSGVGYANNASGYAMFTIYRNSTNLGSSSGMAFNNGTTTQPNSGAVLDSPATTSATTYTVYFASNSGSYTAYFGDSVGGIFPQMTITLMEIAA